jgi:hypothetical protein
MHKWADDMTTELGHLIDSAIMLIIKIMNGLGK